MSDSPALSVTVSRTVPADPDTVWAIISDPDRLAALSPETTRTEWVDGQRGLGARFKGHNRVGWVRWTTVATVTTYEPGRAFGFETSPPSRSRWRYELEPVDGGTRVTESMRKQDPQPAPIRLLMRLVGVTDRAAHLRAGMTETLERLDAAIRAAAPPA